MTTAITISRSDVELAAGRIASYARQTPLLHLEMGAFGLPGQLTLKLELLQHSGSFKARGAYNLLLSRPVPPVGVVAASGGNFGLAIAHAARRLGHRAVVFVPKVTPEAKRVKLRALGAEVVIAGDFYADALEASLLQARDTGALFAHAYDQPEVVAGQGTCARELEGQCPDVETVLVAVGGGGLIGGTATWFQGRVRVVSVESERTPTLAAALRAGQPVDVEVGGVAADSLGARRIGEQGFEAARRWVDRAILVSDDAILAAQKALWDEVKVLCEPGSAAPLAALLTGAYVPEPDERVAVVVCGGNLDPRGLAWSNGSA